MDRVLQARAGELRLVASHIVQHIDDMVAGHTSDEIVEVPVAFLINIHNHLLQQDDVTQKLLQKDGT